MNAKNPKPKNRNLIIFCTVALLIGWIGVLVDRVLPEQEGEESLGMAIWLIFPLITVIILRSFMGDGCNQYGHLDCDVNGVIPTNSFYLASDFDACHGRCPDQPFGH